MLTTVLLYGSLGSRFGKKWRLDIRKPSDVVDAISMKFPDFRRAILEMRDCDFGVTVGEEQIPGEKWQFPNNGATITITPVIRGSDSSKGWIQIIAGIVIIAVAIWTQQYWAVGLGISLALGGVAQLLTPSPSTSSDTESKTRPSYQFGTIINTIGQGECVPVLYGLLWIGSAVVSAAYESVDIVAGSNASGGDTSQTSIDAPGLPVEEHHTAGV